MSVGLLLDTQIVLWWLTASPRLAAAARERIGASACAVSAASVWEVALKHGIGKLPVSPRQFRDELKKAGAVVLAVSDLHAVASDELRIAHRDPFDRLLIATAIVERLVLVTADAALLKFASAPASLPIQAA